MMVIAIYLCVSYTVCTDGYHIFYSTYRGFHKVLLYCLTEHNGTCSGKYIPT